MRDEDILGTSTFQDKQQCGGTMRNRGLKGGRAGKGHRNTCEERCGRRRGAGLAGHKQHVQRDTAQHVSEEEGHPRYRWMSHRSIPSCGPLRALYSQS